MPSALLIRKLLNDKLLAPFNVTRHTPGPLKLTDAKGHKLTHFGRLRRRIAMSCFRGQPEVRGVGRAMAIGVTPRASSFGKPIT